MREYEQRQHPRRLLLKRVFLILLLIILVFLGEVVYTLYQKERITREKRIEAEQNLAELVAREKDLRTDLAHLRSASGFEAELRQQFEMGKEGEGVIVIVDKEAELPPPPPPRPWWQRLLPF